MSSCATERFSLERMALNFNTVSRFVCNVLWETASLALSIYSRVLCSDIHITEYFQQGSNSEICHFTKGTGAFHLVVCLYNFRERDRKRKEVGEGD